MPDPMQVLWQYLLLLKFWWFLFNFKKRKTEILKNPSISSINPGGAVPHGSVGRVALSAPPHERDRDRGRRRERERERERSGSGSQNKHKGHARKRRDRDHSQS